MSFFNDGWIDVWRLLLLLVCTYCLVILGKRWYKYHNDWNVKTNDLWFTLFMWSLAGWVLSFEGIVRDSTLGVRLVFISAAALVCGKALHRKGTWGGRTD